MAQGGLYGRIAARGLHSAVADGLTGSGALDSQGGPTDPAHGENITETGQYSTLPGYLPEGPADVSVPLLEGTWGISGAGENPDQTPQTHAAPVPGWAGSYKDPALLEMHDRSAEIHAIDFGALARRTQSPRAIAEPDLDVEHIASQGEVPLDPVTGQLRAMGHYDGVQGYGGGADGPGGTNSYGFSDVRRTRITANGHQPMAYLDPAERPYIVPQVSGTFTPTDAVWGPDPDPPFRVAPALNTTPPSPYQAPPEPDQAAAPPVGGVVSAGWW
jgi:hypothetical protein